MRTKEEPEMFSLKSPLRTWFINTWGQTQFSLAARPTQQQILALASDEALRKNALKLIG
jgi:hypothetical protein